jgi:hypothetical protein
MEIHHVTHIPFPRSFFQAVSYIKPTATAMHAAIYHSRPFISEAQGDDDEAAKVHRPDLVIRA